MRGTEADHQCAIIYEQFINLIIIIIFEVIASATAKAAEEDEKLAAMREHERVVRRAVKGERVLEATG